MAKKKENPAEMPVEDRLKNLFQLQTILTEIDRIRTLRGELPLEVEDLEDTIEGLKTRISKTEAEIADLRAKINEYKGKIELANSQLATYKEQMDNVRNNREYDLLNKEIEFQTLEIELCNKRIREAQGLERGREEALARSHEELDGRLQDLEVKKNELDEKLDVRMRKKVIVCEYCGRILIDPELAGVKPDVPAEEKPKRRTRRKKEE